MSSSVTSPSSAPPSTLEAYRDARSALARAQKSNASVPPYSRYVNRPLGGRIAAAGAAIGATPNQVTALSALWSLIGFALLVAVPPGVGVAVAVTILFTLSWAFDAADGQLARLTATAGPAGEWLDHVVDSARQILLHVSVLIYLLRADDFVFGWVHLLPLAYLLVISVRYFSQMLAGQLTERAGAPPAAESGRERLRAWLQQPADPSTLHLTFLLAGSPDAFTIAYGVVFLANLPLALASFARRYRQLARL